VQRSAITKQGLPETPIFKDLNTIGAAPAEYLLVAIPAREIRRSEDSGNPFFSVPEERDASSRSRQCPGRDIFRAHSVLQFANRSGADHRSDLLLKAARGVTIAVVSSRERKRRQPGLATIQLS